MFSEVAFDPGIFGFVKAHRHISGPALVMSVWEEENREWAAVYWVKRLHHAANPIETNLFQIINKKTMRAVERTYEILMSSEPPLQAFSEKPDFQRRRVYDWEEDNILPGFKPLSWEKCKDYLTTVWRKVGRGPEPLLTVDKRLHRPMAYLGEIALPEKFKKDAWTKPVLLHEIAHELVFEAKHGPVFVSHYIDLCVEFLGFDRRILRESADRYGVIYFA